MGLENLEELLKMKKKNAERNLENLEEIKKQWFEQVENFFTKIKSYLLPLKDKDLLNFYFEEIIVREEYLGEYTVQKLVVCFPDQEVIIKPIGRNIIGAKGRIDMIGKNGELKFLLVHEEAGGPKVTMNFGDGFIDAYKQIKNNHEEVYTWKIVTPPPNVKYIDINSDSFSDALIGVMLNE